MSLWRENSWCLAIIFMIFLLNIEIINADFLEIEYPNEINFGEKFSVIITLIDFQEDVYDIKIDILTNEDDERISRIWNYNIWKSTHFYINDILEIPEKNSDSFHLNITKKYQGNATMYIKIRNSEENIINITEYDVYINMPESSEESEDSENNEEENQETNEDLEESDDEKEEKNNESNKNQTMEIESNSKARKNNELSIEKTITTKTISLSKKEEQKDIKTEDYISKPGENKYLIYSVILTAVLIMIFFILRKIEYG